MSNSFRVLITDRAWPDCELEREILAEIRAEVLEPPDPQEDTLLEFAGDVDAIATCWAPVTGRIVRAARRCRIIARFGIGLDNIAVDAATELGMPVTNVPDYCVEEVSDHALALLLACARKVAWFHHQAKQGEYDRQAVPPLRRLSGQTLGLVGLGRTAQALIPKARALNLNVIATTPSGSDYGTGCRMVSFDELLEQSDYISLHLPLTEASHRMFGAPEFRRMQASAYLINTSRGGLIDHAALLAALERGELAGAALDVFDPEPPDLSQPLFRDPRVIVTPHVAFLSEESLAELRTRTAQQVSQALQGLRPENVVNPEVYATSR